MPQVFGILGGDCFAAFLSHTSLYIKGCKNMSARKNHALTHTLWEHPIIAKSIFNRFSNSFVCWFKYRFNYTFTQVFNT